MHDHLRVGVGECGVSSLVSLLGRTVILSDQNPSPQDLTLISSLDPSPHRVTLGVRASTYEF